MQENQEYFTIFLIYFTKSSESFHNLIMCFFSDIHIHVVNKKESHFKLHLFWYLKDFLVVKNATVNIWLCLVGF